MADKPRIAHLSGSNATISNSPPLVTSNKARSKYGLPPRTNADGSIPRFDVLRPQRLAAPVTIYVEQFSAHPLEADAAELYGAPDKFLDAKGMVHATRQHVRDKPVYRIDLDPEDGLYPLPYMARQADGSAWEDDCAVPGAPAEKSRQPCYPDGSRIFEEIDRFGIGEDGTGNLVSSMADMDFFRILPSTVTQKDNRQTSAPMWVTATFRRRHWGTIISCTERPICQCRRRDRPWRASPMKSRRSSTPETIWGPSGHKVPRVLKRRSSGSTWCSTRRCRSSETPLSARMAKSAMMGQRILSILWNIFLREFGRMRPAAIKPAWWLFRNNRYSRREKFKKGMPVPAAILPRAGMVAFWAPCVDTAYHPS